MTSLSIVLATLTAAIGSLILVFMLYIAFRYSPIVARIFEEKPLFLPLRVSRPLDAEDVCFAADDGTNLLGSYLGSRSTHRLGVIVFCHEYLSDRWSVLPYLDKLRDIGFDLFTFDFRNHGESDHDRSYQPLQWVTNKELADLNAAMRYLRTRDDSDPAGVALFGVSRGGGTALCVGSSDPGVWGVITDGAFPTRGTMVSYIHRWAKIFVSSPRLWSVMPNFMFEFLAWSGRMRTQSRLRIRYSDVEKAAARLAPRPWLAIHGEKDAYIGVDIAKSLFSRASSPKELWTVANAKHNRCREKDPFIYAEKVRNFFQTWAPRRIVKDVAPISHGEPGDNLFLSPLTLSHPSLDQPFPVSSVQTIY